MFSADATRRIDRGTTSIRGVAAAENHIRAEGAAENTPSGVQQLDTPPIPFTHEQLSLVQAIRASAPELDRARLKAEAGPVRWTGHALAFELALELRDTGVEIRRALHRPALPRCPSADLAAA